LVSFFLQPRLCPPPPTPPLPFRQRTSPIFLFWSRRSIDPSPSFSPQRHMQRFFGGSFFPNRSLSPGSFPPPCRRVDSPGIFRWSFRGDQPPLVHAMDPWRGRFSLTPPFFSRAKMPPLSIFFFRNPTFRRLSLVFCSVFGPTMVRPPSGFFFSRGLRPFLWTLSLYGAQN